MPANRATARGTAGTARSDGAGAGADEAAGARETDGAPGAGNPGGARYAPDVGNATDSDAAAELAARLRAAIQHLLPLLRAQSVHSDLTPSRLAALAALGDAGPLRISDLAGRMGIALSTASRMIDLLEGLGWTERRPDPVDQRASLVSLGHEGRALLDAVRKEHAGKLANEIARLRPDHARRLHDALPALEALAAAAPPRVGPCADGRA
ncbi:MarR family transcriptional regulator [Streptomyces sp. TS71-3]|uniref:MarR family transcriptional regulator n=1 Tax=Streptomyces sp. TS71-3 TaxID=2733862 RepID=UPI0020175CDA|nr:MarR family transcriptional regulator [Streptomyces sp. TS71-3]